MDFIKSVFSGSKKSSNPPPPVYGPTETSPNISGSKQEKLIDIPIIKKEKPKSEGSQTDLKVDYKKVVSLKLDSRYGAIKSSAESQKVPLMVSLVPVNDSTLKQRGGLDIIIVIDISGSMGGEKIKLVVETLLFIIDEMQEIDRLSLVAFDDYSEVLTNLTPMTQANKEVFKKVVLSKIHARGSTNIKLGLIDGFEVLLNRKEVNDVTAVLFLSDGQDTCGNSLTDFEATLKEYDAKMNKKGMAYKINSFGYGEGHDEKALGLIANFKEGSFYYIKSLQLVDECFIDCMGYLMSIFANQAEVTLFMDGKTIITKKHGKTWVDDANQAKASLKIGNIAVGLEKNFICEINIPPTEGLTEIKLCSAILNFVASKENQMIDAQLTLPVVDGSALGPANEKVDQNVMRVEAAEVLRLAEEDYKKGDKKEAKRKVHDWKVNNVYGKVSEKEQARVECLMADDIFDNQKDLEENFHVLEKQAYIPSKANYSSSNQIQCAMLSKKKGS